MRILIQIGSGSSRLKWSTKKEKTLKKFFMFVVNGFQGVKRNTVPLCYVASFDQNLEGLDPDPDPDKGDLVKNPSI